MILFFLFSHLSLKARNIFAALSLGSGFSSRAERRRRLEAATELQEGSAPSWEIRKSFF